ncbi:GAF domain-containing protein [Neolewinella antarctica]|uniref:GAF domain-containing protein n=1 Tax=Neolewinella antarctica TaxID=442734 RepID=A0ABX0XHB4_9BACT|nr:GAF domain-containing protein [Neolewinella antarctica]NJC28142.1 hypothetical protein [Neolewinella antarctica]
MELEITVGKQDSGSVELPVEFLRNDLPDQLREDLFSMPYRSVLCLDLIFQRVEKLVQEDDLGIKFLGEELLRRVAEVPELRSPIQDLSLLKQHRGIMELLMLFIVPPAERTTSLFKFSKPFHFTPVYVSPGMKALVATDNACYSFSGKMETVIKRHQIMVGAQILKKFYGVNIDVIPTAMLVVQDQKSGLDCFYQPQMNDDFVEIIAVGELPELSRDDINRLMTNISDTDLWLEMLPPESFEFHGLHISHLFDVTEEEALSRLKHRLISRDAILDVDRVQELANLVRVHFRNPALQLGLTAIDFPLNRAIDHEYRIRFNLLADSVDRLTGADFAGSIYEQACVSREVVVIEDLRQLDNPGKMERSLMRLGLRSILIAPLLDQNRNVIGIVELGCPKPYSINAFLELKFREIRGLFRTAVERSREYIDNRIEAIMREHYTSLHSSVEWKFTEAAFDILQQIELGEKPVSQEIAFNNVFPLYGQADIVGSSGIRNASIHQDLVDNLRAGRFFLTKAMEEVTFPLIQQVVQFIDISLLVEQEEFDNGHEIQMGDLIHHQITPLIDQLGRQEASLKLLSHQYLEHLDRDLGLYARNRTDYEKSVNRINKELSEFFTARDQAAQVTLPHYFEKYKTDGVEYEIYAGQSLLKNQEFSDVHLRNFRLSQLIDMADATRLVDQVSSEIPMPLRTAQLIFAYTSPLDIKFRMDEKHFDVDGDYNVRYEILKKRIDKATIRKGEERLTLADHISIVYLQDRDREEYLGYLDYLQQAGYVDGEIEDLVLDPLQSVNGLRALRFRVFL